ncbi:MAG TPA: hypothetical protein VFY62_08635 [Pseudomonas sp.]|nr:hypothetical protein [Pseudomonas sp.]
MLAIKPWQLSIAVLCGRVRHGEVRRVLLQPESHDELIDRPELLEAGSGLWISLN